LRKTNLYALVLLNYNGIIIYTKKGGTEVPPICRYGHKTTAIYQPIEGALSATSVVEAAARSTLYP
jgi:hypothetical protein